MKPMLPKYVKEIMELMHEADFHPYLVGGCVRDRVMGITPHDYDMTVAVTPERITELFNKNGYRIIPKGQKFGTVGVIVNDEVIEITPYRTEDGYSDSRHPDNVTFVNDIRMDLSRRDFTINAMAMDKDGNLLDMFGGIKDIEGMIIRAVGDPSKRFNEDALRIMRAIRFASRFGFDIEKNTRSAMSRHSAGLSNISAERILSELKGTLCFPGCYKILRECDDILKQIIDGFTPDEYLLKDSGDFISKFFSCIHRCSEETVKDICRYMKMSNIESEKLQAMHEIYNNKLTRCGRRIIFDNNTKSTLCVYKTEYVTDTYKFSDSKTDELFEFLENGIYNKERLNISGGEIASSGLFPKSLTSRILDRILNDVCIGKIPNQKNRIFDYLSQLSVNEFE